MSKYKIAGLTVEMNPMYDPLKSQSAAYLAGDSVCEDFCIDVPHELIVNKAKELQALSVGECEYSWYGYNFYRNLLDYNGMLIHSSCVALDGNAYLFSAPSGTGKSTHTALWKEYFGEKLAYVNDDKPALRMFDDRIYACGTPFSGKTALNSNISVPLKGICILARGDTNHIERADPKRAIHKLLNQTYRPRDERLMNKALDMLSLVLERVPIYELYCNISEQAVLTSYEFMNR